MNLFLFALWLLLGCMTLVFALALQRRDNSIVDIAYGLAFVLVGWSSTLKGGSRNIRAHYDLSNDFFASFLDPSMTYSAARFGDSLATSLLSLALVWALVTPLLLWLSARIEPRPGRYRALFR